LTLKIEGERAQILKELKKLRRYSAAKWSVLDPDHGRQKGKRVWKEIKAKKAAKWSTQKRVVVSRKRNRNAVAPVIEKDAFKPDARSVAVLQGVRIAQEDLREAGGAYDLEQVRTLMHGVSRQAIDKRVSEGTLLTVPGPSNRRSYPTLQFNADGSVVEGLKLVREALPTSNPWMILNFFARPDDRLNGHKPIDVLKAGDIGLVVEAAHRLGQQGA